MAYQEISIGSLERGVRTLAKKFKAAGLRTDVYVSKSGHGGDPLVSGPSYVELEVTGAYVADDGEQEEASAYAKFIANGYEGHRRDEFGGTQGWVPMRNAATAYIITELAAQGWVPGGATPNAGESSAAFRRRARAFAGAGNYVPVVVVAGAGAPRLLGATDVGSGGRRLVRWRSTKRVEVGEEWAPKG